MKTGSLTLIYITNPSEAEAKKIAVHLLNNKLIACANLFPINSLYWWKGKIKDEKEIVLLAKTTEENFEKIKKEVESIHSYSIPCVLKIPAEANERYSGWVKGETRQT